MERAKTVINSLLTDVFNQILILEERNLTENNAKDVTMTEIHVIEAIRKSEVATMGNVAKRLLITMGTLTTSVNRLVDKGYVTRKRDVNDRRIVLLDLTEKGQEIFEIHEKFHSELVNAALKDLEIRDDQQIVQSLESIQRFFKKLHDKHV
ncbi:MAG: MarR family winged helix-turn-helix transcriptional regulator [Turicibacter sp.]